MAGAVWLAGADLPHCHTLYPAEDDYFVQLRAVPLDMEHRSRRSRWESHKGQSVTRVATTCATGISASIWAAGKKT